MNEIDDPLTDQDKINLLAFWDKYAAKDQTLFDFPYLPCFSQYEPDLIFTDPEDNAGKPGQHWDGTQTAFDIQEPPQESKKGFKAAIVGLWHNKDFAAILAAIAWVFVVLLVFGY